MAGLEPTLLQPEVLNFITQRVCRIDWLFVQLSTCITMTHFRCHQKQTQFNWVFSIGELLSVQVFILPLLVFRKFGWEHSVRLKVGTMCVCVCVHSNSSSRWIRRANEDFKGPPRSSNEAKENKWECRWWWWWMPGKWLTGWHDRNDKKPQITRRKTKSTVISLLLRDIERARQHIGKAVHTHTYRHDWCSRAVATVCFGIFGKGGNAKDELTVEKDNFSSRLRGQRLNENRHFFDKQQSKMCTNLPLDWVAIGNKSMFLHSQYSEQRPPFSDLIYGWPGVGQWNHFKIIS